MQWQAAQFGCFRAKAVVSGLEEDFATSTAAIKMCKSNADASQIRALALELKIMIHLGKHLNIVNLMGASTVDIGKCELWILVEYCRFGNLQVFLQRHRRQFVNQIDPTTGRIDLTRTTRATSPLSPSAYSNSIQSEGRKEKDLLYVKNV
ncbi:hypothetical protein Pcinc_005715 [Petrolisthes cinctipes]|uniref:Protein kinase domain-containing protein n=1 Tax=Petrolisthes cinctipes TaxID=88211 RepID=A0AAE1GCY1_PETCI|nr:hypothetical protein Pcinc_005715 [Petrolisthes cinctipes]